MSTHLTQTQMKSRSSSILEASTNQSPETLKSQRYSQVLTPYTSSRYKKETARNVTLACDDDQIKAHKGCWCDSFRYQTQDKLHQIDFLGTNDGTQDTIKTEMVVEFREDLALEDDGQTSHLIITASTSHSEVLQEHQLRAHNEQTLHQQPEPVEDAAHTERGEVEEVSCQHCRGWRVEKWLVQDGGRP